jgi:ATP-dependent DNA helicase RecG
MALKACMRPESLYPLFKEVAGLSGVGAGTAKLLARLEITRVVDLLFDVPTGQIERVALPDVLQARADMQVVLALDVVEHLPATSPRAPWRVACLDARGMPVLLIFFASAAHYIPRQLKVGQSYLVAGKLELFGGRWQISHPDRIQPQESAEPIPLRECVYRLTAGLSAKRRRLLAAQALQGLASLPEWIEPGLKAAKGWPDWHQALQAVHNNPADAGARARLAYDELLANQLALRLLRARASTKARHCRKTPHVRRYFWQTCPLNPQAHSCVLWLKLGRIWPKHNRCSACCKAMLALAKRW